MRLALALCVAALPAVAQETSPAPKGEGEGFSLMEEGAKLVLRGFMSEMQPTFDEMEKALTDVGPKLEVLSDEVAPKFRQLMALIDDVKNYEGPVMLPNGDILIRRKTPVAPQSDSVPGPNGEIDL